MNEAVSRENEIHTNASLPVEQSSLRNGSKTTTVKEGLAYILTPANSATSLDPKKGAKDPNDDTQLQSVFYNPIQQFNRDLSVLAIRAYSEDLIALRESKSRAQRQRRDQRRQKVFRKDETDPNNTAPQVDVEQDQRNAEAAEALTQLGAANTAKRKADEGEETLPGENEQSRPSKLSKTQGVDDETVSRPDIDTNGAEPGAAAQQRELAPREDVSSAPIGEDQRKYPFTILDALSATGLRALRYAKEIPAVTSITANDMSPDATRCIELNVRHNELEEKISVTTGNAIGHMYNFVSLGSRNVMPNKGKNQIPPTSGKYDVIDLDPYGTAVPFLDAALQAINDGGLLCVTCTDAGVWASCGYPEKTFALYGGTPIKGHHSHEGGLRLIIHAISTTAARYGIAVEPLLSLSIDFYARVFVRIRKSAADVKFLCGKTMLVYSCDSGCGAWKTQDLGRNDTTKGKKGANITKHGLAQGPSCSPFCEHCGFKTHMSGPMYGGPIHNRAFIQAILDDVPQLDKDTYHTIDRIEGMLSTALEETSLEHSVDEVSEVDRTARLDRPVPPLDPAANDRHHFFFLPSALAGVLHCQAPGEAAVKGALRHAGYRVTRSHAKGGSIRTDAPWSFIWHMMHEWIRQKAPVKEGAIKPGTAGFGIMERLRLSAQAAAVRSAEGAKTLFISGGYTIASGDTDASTSEVVFDETLGRDPDRKRLIRYQTNPRANWGPMHRAKKGQKVAKP